MNGTSDADIAAMSIAHVREIASQRFKDEAQDAARRYAAGLRPRPYAPSQVDFRREGRIEIARVYRRLGECHTEQSARALGALKAASAIYDREFGPGIVSVETQICDLPREYGCVERQLAIVATFPTAQAQQLPDDAAAHEKAQDTPPQRTLVIIGCGAQKRDYKCAASKLYTGGLFVAALSYARSIARDEDIRILSAKHGLLELDTPVEPYNTTWHMGPCISHRELTEQIPDEWKNAHFVLLCGQDYRLAIGYAHYYRFHEAMNTSIPLSGLGIGQQKKWLMEHTPKTQSALVPEEAPMILRKNAPVLDAANIDHIENCNQEERCLRCLELLEWYSGCESCGRAGHKHELDYDDQTGHYTCKRCQDEQKAPTPLLASVA
jgi:hypothetical protein